MKSLVPILEQELGGAVDVRDESFLHRYVTLMVENFVQKEEQVSELSVIRSDIKILADTMKQGFDRIDKRFDDMLNLMDKRFEAVDKRFDDVNLRFEDMNRRFDDMQKRFVMMFSFMTVGFVVLSTVITLLRLFG